MKKTIKFRAWCPKQERMLNPFTLEQALDENPANWHKGEDIFMQFTGLLDKNGKEIYEGDIVNADRHSAPNFKVVFHEGAFRLKDKMDRVMAQVTSGFEVIGNIYENNDLLK